MSHFLYKMYWKTKHIYGGKSIRIYLKTLLWLLLHSGMITNFSFLLYIFLFFFQVFSMRVYYFHDWKSPIKLFRETTRSCIPDSFLYINIFAFLPKKDMVLPAFLDRFRRLAREINHGPEHLGSHCKPPAIGTAAQWTVGNIYWIYLKSIQRS